MGHMAAYIWVLGMGHMAPISSFFITIGINFEIENEPSKTQIIHMALERPTKTNIKIFFQLTKKKNSNEINSPLRKSANDVCILTRD